MVHRHVAITLLVLACACCAWAESYVGPQKCMACHNSPDIGDQYGAWSSSKHARAYDVLSSSKAASVAKSVGVSDPLKDKRCLTCHTTAYDVAAANKGGVTPDQGVSCEACHGPGAAYTSVHMRDYKGGLAAGMVSLRSRADAERVCRRCHGGPNKGIRSPHSKAFKGEKYFVKIAHPRPRKAK
ncbi:MAG: cytochrome c family protein [Candidatus Riflebacteria bacterium]|nr:cytochrome c family protein [Candidatus Riflebacteria bacterium]